MDNSFFKLLAVASFAHLHFKNCFIIYLFCYCFIINVIYNSFFAILNAAMEVSSIWVLTSVPGNIWTTTLAVPFFAFG